MATRIKRYEERRERMPDLLARIEREMGPDAQIEQKFFKRGALLGFLGGLSMVEVVATVEVNDEQLRIGNYHRRAGDGNGHGASPEQAESVAQENLAAAVQQAARTSAPRMVPPPGELAATKQQAGTGRVDVRADEPMRVSLASGVLELDPATPAPAAPARIARPAPAAAVSAGISPVPSPVKPDVAPNAMAAKSLTSAAPIGEPGALNETLPEVFAPAPAEPAVPPAAAPAELRKDLAELRSSISELKETVQLLVQAQARSSRKEEHAQASSSKPGAGPASPADQRAGLHGLAPGGSIPQDSPAGNLAQAIQQAQADETQQLLELHTAVPANAATVSGAAASVDVANPLALDPAAALSTAQREAYEVLLDWNIGPYDALELINTALTSITEPGAFSSADIIKVVTGSICRNILLSGGIKLGKTPPGKVVALIGATGVGKTTTIAKLAAKFAFQEGQRVSLVSLDNYRIAAAEQLRTYSEIMGIDLDIVFSKDEFDTQLAQRRHSDLVLIDTAGRSPINTKQIYELREVFAAHPPDEVHLVVSASTKGDDLRAILENFTPLGYDHIIVSKLDETRSLGAIYNISKYSSCPISYVTVGQRVPEDIRTATLPFIQQWIEQGRAL